MFLYFESANYLHFYIQISECVITWLSLFCIKLMSKDYGILLNFPPIDFYNDRRWATLTQILRHMLKPWILLITLIILDVNECFRSWLLTGNFLFVKRLYVVPLHMIISLNASAQYPSASLFLSLCCHNITLKISPDRMQRACSSFFFFVTILKRTWCSCCVKGFAQR